MDCCYFRLSIVKAIAGAFLACHLDILAHASGMRPDMAAVIVEESKGEATVKVTNTDSAPALLYTRIEEVKPVPNHPVPVIITPPIARVEGGEVQLVRVILQTPQPLTVEHYKRIIFEGIPQRAAGEGHQVNFTVRQNLPLVIRPKGLTSHSEPWKSLLWSIDTAGRLHVDNPSPYVVRLSNRLHLLPKGGARTLPNPYILPGETITLPQPLSVADKRVKAIKIEPVDDDGLPIQGGYTVPLAQTSNR